MKKKKNNQLIQDVEVIFEMNSNGRPPIGDDPTTSLATTTFTHILTLQDHLDPLEK